MILDAKENGGGWKGKPRASGDDPAVGAGGLVSVM